MRTLTQEELGEVSGGCSRRRSSSHCGTRRSCDPKPACNPKPACDPKPTCNPKPDCNTPVDPPVSNEP